MRKINFNNFIKFLILNLFLLFTINIYGEDGASDIKLHGNNNGKIEMSEKADSTKDKNKYSNKTAYFKTIIYHEKGIKFANEIDKDYNLDNYYYVEFNELGLPVKINLIKYKTRRTVPYMIIEYDENNKPFTGKTGSLITNFYYTNFNALYKVTYTTDDLRVVYYHIFIYNDFGYAKKIMVYSQGSYNNFYITYEYDDNKNIISRSIYRSNDTLKIKTEYNENGDKLFDSYYNKNGKLTFKKSFRK